MLDFNVFGVNKYEDDISYFLRLELMKIDIPKNELSKHERLKNKLNNFKEEIIDDDVIQYYLEEEINLRNKNIFIEHANSNYQEKKIELVNVKRNLKKQFKNDLKEVKKNSTIKINIEISDVYTFIGILIPLFFLGSYMYNYIYYSQFDLKISQYFNASDYLSTSINNIKDAIIASSLPILIMLLRLGHITRSDFFTDKFRISKKEKIYDVIFFIAFTTLVTYWWIKGSYISYDFLLLVFIIPIVRLSNYLSKYFKKQFQSYIMLIFFLLFLVKIVLSSFQDVYFIKNEMDTDTMDLELKNKYDFNRENLILLGKNSSYIFLSDSIFENKWVIPVNGIKHIRLKK